MGDISPEFYIYFFRMVNYELEKDIRAVASSDKIGVAIFSLQAMNRVLRWWVSECFENRTARLSKQFQPLHRFTTVIGKQNRVTRSMTRLEPEIIIHGVDLELVSFCLSVAGISLKDGMLGRCLLSHIYPLISTRLSA